ncbi:hypothetical protein RHMOL_Rhmol03G0057000 [Rhododendron molle]|uniref:Uncharacterized protein n=1 Tax=Rhododendron molle TaxID=49168 RepID=A0ACC0PAL1_RHOML|nr:hypothetical protein RHMOL_Rhmol03G0057000 [Rhododendron molle]
MLRLKDNIEREPAMTSDQLEEPQAEEEDGEFVYFAFGFYIAADLVDKERTSQRIESILENNGSGYPEVEDGKKPGGDQHMSSSVVLLLLLEVGMPAGD